MGKITDLSVPQLEAWKKETEAQYQKFAARKLKLDMSRGKPAGSQLDLCNALLGPLDNYKAADGTDLRNYGILTGIPEAKKLFGDLLGLNPDRILIGGNASLNLMYDTLVRHWIFGTHGCTPWGKLPEVKFLCPAPGYDRHFAITQELGIQMITIPMTPEGPDMDLVEKYAQDPAVKGIWCVPLYSNPMGAVYSDKVVDRLASMKTGAADFRIMWDNAYGIHHIYEECHVKDIFKACEEAENPERAYYFFSTSKITFPGAGVALLATGPENMEETKKHLGIATIGYDKINQLRTIAFLKNPENVHKHMKRLAEELRPKFDIVLKTLKKELAGTGLATWTDPKGGYFVALDTLPGCAKRTVELAKNAGVKLTGAGATFPYGKDPQDSNIRIAPTYPTCEELQTAMDLFCVCVKLAGAEKLLAR